MKDSGCPNSSYCHFIKDTAGSKTWGLVGLKNELVGLQDLSDSPDSRGTLLDLVDVTLFGELSLRPAAHLLLLTVVEDDVILPHTSWVWEDFDGEDLAEIPDDDVKVPAPAISLPTNSVDIPIWWGSEQHIRHTLYVNMTDM